jgi:hypothetical protein
MLIDTQLTNELQMPTPINKLPRIFIDLQQPGDVGDFFYHRDRCSDP